MKTDMSVERLLAHAVKVQSVYRLALKMWMIERDVLLAYCPPVVVNGKERQPWEPEYWEAEDT